MLSRLPGLALALTCALLVTGCGGGEQGSGPQTPAGEATSPAGSATERADAELVIWADEHRGTALEEIAEDFGSQNDVTVAVQTIPAEALQLEFITANNAGTGPDVVVGPHQWIGTLVQNGAIDTLPISTADQSRYSDIAIDAVTFNRQPYGLPYAIESVALYRNTAMVPAAPQSVEELITAGRRSGAGRPLCLPVGEDGNHYAMHPLYTSAGGYVFGTTRDGGYDPSDLGVGREGSLTAAQMISELGDRGVLSTSVTPDNAVTLFTEGRCPFLISGPAALTDVREADMEVEIGPVVGFEDMQPARPLTEVQTFFVASKGRNKPFALQLVLDALNSPDSMRQLFDDERRPPAMTEVLEDVQAEMPGIAALATAAEEGQVLPAIPQMAVVWEPLGRAEAAIIEGADPVFTMQAAGQTITDRLQSPVP